MWGNIYQTISLNNKHSSDHTTNQMWPKGFNHDRTRHIIRGEAGECNAVMTRTQLRDEQQRVL